MRHPDVRATPLQPPPADGLFALATGGHPLAPLHPRPTFHAPSQAPTAPPTPAKPGQTTLPFSLDRERSFDRLACSLTLFDRASPSRTPCRPASAAVPAQPVDLDENKLEPSLWKIPRSLERRVHPSIDGHRRRQGGGATRGLKCSTEISQRFSGDRQGFIAGISWNIARLISFQPLAI